MVRIDKTEVTSHYLVFRQTDNCLCIRKCTLPQTLIKSHTEKVSSIQCLFSLFVRAQINLQRTARPNFNRRKSLFICLGHVYSCAFGKMVAEKKRTVSMTMKDVLTIVITNAVEVLASVFCYTIILSNYFML